MKSARNVSQKESKAPIKMGGKVLNEEEIQECLSKGGMILSSGSMAMPLSEEESLIHRFRVRRKNAEERFIEAYRKIEAGSYTEDDILFIIKEGHINIRTAYGVYLSLCAEKQVEKIITWRTFYMQCNGYRTIKPNTMEAIARFTLTPMGHPLITRKTNK